MKWYPHIWSDIFDMNYVGSSCGREADIFPAGQFCFFLPQTGGFYLALFQYHSWNFSIPCITLISHVDPMGPIIIFSEKIHQSKSSETWSRTKSPMCTNFKNWQSSLGRIVQACCSMHVTWLSQWKPLDRTQSLNWRFAEYEAKPKFTLGMTSEQFWMKLKFV